MDERAFRATAREPLRKQLRRRAAAAERHGENPPTGLAEPPAALAQALERDFGSVMTWRAEFTSMAKALAGGSGWAILAWSERLGRLVNQWAADHAHGLSGAAPILALDMYEHAYHLDFGAKASAYVDQLMANLNWERIGARYRLAIGEGAGESELFLPFGAPAQQDARISAEELKAVLENGDDRRPPSGSLSAQRPARRTDMLAGASMHAPAALPRWIEQLPRGRPIVVYCICGFQVSGTAVKELRQQNLTPGLSSAGLPPGMQLVALRCRWTPRPTRKRRKHTLEPQSPLGITG